MFVLRQADVCVAYINTSMVLLNLTETADCYTVYKKNVCVETGRCLCCLYKHIHGPPYLTETADCYTV